MDQTGNFVVVWQSFHQDGNIFGVFFAMVAVKDNTVGIT
jgi:hypothetical protein